MVIHYNRRTQLHCFQRRTTLNGIDFKFVSHGQWSEKRSILRQRMHKKILDFEINLKNVEISLNTKTRLRGHDPLWPLKIIQIDFRCSCITLNEQLSL
jgi:hypothetical protein